VLFDSAERLIHAPEVGYITGLIPVTLTFATGAVFFTLSRRLMRRTREPSPLLIAYKADYFIGMMTDGGVLIAFVGFLSTKDLGGLLGLWTATGVAVWRSRRRGGPPSLRRWRLRAEDALLRWRLDRLRKRSRLRVVDGGRPGGPTIN